MELRHLRYFAAVAEELHFGRAADRLAIAQPPLSQQIQALERELGVRLLTRTKRKVELTEAGRLFLAEAKATLEQAEKARRVAQLAARGALGRLEIGFTGSAPFNQAMPNLIGQFRTAWPEVQLTLREMSTTAQFAALADGSLDAGFVRPGHETDLPNLELKLLLREPLMVVLSANHPLAACAAVPVAALAGEKFILHPRHIGTGLYDKVIGLCRQAGFTPELALEAHQMSTIVSLAAIGLGVSIVAESMSNLHVEGAALRPLTAPDAFMDLCVAYRRDALSPPARHFIAIAEAAATQP